ncbi:hypothetical protein I3760_04G148100 [Carya illinoinensis]|nr:hypothetical protein I3760_04G148100 [Carya illinoinensis]
MGFKNLHNLNVALLAKQGWRLLTSVDSLLHKIFKARYFPKCSLFDSKIGFNSSYVWRGIYSALTLLRSRCLWRVGNGDQIKVFQDSWIPGIQKEDFQGVNQIPSHQNLRVKDLLDLDTGWWNVEILRALFNPRVVSQILKLNVSFTHDDSWYWASEKNGQYSVCSGYNMLQHAIY